MSSRNQGEVLMQRKTQSLIERHKSISALHPDNVFHFTEQCAAVGPDEATSTNVQMPDNWTDASTGSYFTSKRSEPSHYKLHSQHHGTTSPLPSSNNGSSTKTPKHLSPLKRQEEFDRIVQSRILNALEEQRQMEADRLESCKVQRDVQLFKLQQKIKHRSELQCLSGQKLIGHSIDTLGLEPLQQSRTTSSLERTAHQQDRDDHRADAQRHYTAFHRDRIERDQLHRQYCRELLAEKTKFRQGMEAHVGTAFSLSKTATLNKIGIEGMEATYTVLPSVNELHQEHGKLAQQRKQGEQEAAAVQTAYDELSRFDEGLWEERRAQKGKKAVRTLELPYSSDAPYKQAK